MNKIVRQIGDEQCRSGIPDFGPGDSVTVHVLIVEGSKERTQAFTGTVIAREGGGINETFTLRRVAHGVGVERLFPINSPRLEKIVVENRGRVRRSKLYYLRERVGKHARIKPQAFTKE